MKTVSRKKRLGEILIEQGLLNQETLNGLLPKMDHEHRLGTVLLEQGLVTEEQLAEALSLQHQRPYVPLTDFRLDPQFFKTIPVELMYRYPFVPIKEEKGLLTVALADPGNLLTI